MGAELAETHEDLNHHLEPLMIQILIRSIGGALEQGAQTAEGLLVGGGGGGGALTQGGGGKTKGVASRKRTVRRMLRCDACTE